MLPSPPLTDPDVLEAHGGLAQRSPAGGLPTRDEIGGRVPPIQHDRGVRHRRRTPPLPAGPAAPRAGETPAAFVHRPRTSDAARPPRPGAPKPSRPGAPL